MRPQSSVAPINNGDGELPSNERKRNPNWPSCTGRSGNIGYIGLKQKKKLKL